jgi:hypothetical protein
LHRHQLRIGDDISAQLGRRVAVGGFPLDALSQWKIRRLSKFECRHGGVPRGEDRQDREVPGQAGGCQGRPPGQAVRDGPRSRTVREFYSQNFSTRIFKMQVLPLRSKIKIV